MINWSNLTNETTQRLQDEKWNIVFRLSQPKSSNWAYTNRSEKDAAKVKLNNINFELAKKYRR